MGLVVVNIVSLIMFGLVIVMFVLADSIGGIAIGIGLSLIWLVFTIAENIHILKGRGSTDSMRV